ncbi:hypothetical protein ACA910_009396 [Epithemia clementina (nom. ined.)]
MDPPQHIPDERYIFHDEECSPVPCTKRPIRSKDAPLEMSPDPDISSEVFEEEGELEELQKRSDMEIGDQPMQKSDFVHCLAPPGHYDRTTSSEILERIDRLLGIPTEAFESSIGDGAGKYGDSVLSISHFSSLGVDTKLHPDSQSRSGPPLFISPSFRRSSGLSKDDNNPYFDSTYDRDSVLSSVGTHSVGSAQRQDEPIEQGDGLVSSKRQKRGAIMTVLEGRNYPSQQKIRFSGAARLSLIAAVILLFLALVLLGYAFTTATADDRDASDTSNNRNGFDDDEFWKTYYSNRPTDPAKKFQTPDSRPKNILSVDSANPLNAEVNETQTPSAAPTTPVPTTPVPTTPMPTTPVPTVGLSKFPSMSPSFLTGVPSFSLAPSIFPSNFPSNFPSDAPSDFPSNLDVFVDEEPTADASNDLIIVKKTAAPTKRPTRLPSSQDVPPVLSGKKRR